ncbi:hypothetical protein K474DRAFT_1671657 [Panus rudis PR-1116 ss-1]|nr:hypothetical protein K474DRAFT_1671657 [Panus rudis PR-1116 ss-1]
MTVPSLVFALLLARSSSAFFTPTEPSPGDSYNSGENCTIAWIPDTDGIWTNVTINLMSGSNTDMTLVSNVASFLDGTDPALTPFSWLCPDVSPNSAIYFYQFTNNDDITESKWTTRFTIASPNGESSPPEYSLQPTGDYIPWGVGHLSTVDDADDDYDGGSDVTSDSPDTFTGDSSICKREPRDHYRFDTSEDTYDHDHGEDDDHYSDSDPEVLRDEPDDEEDQEANETTGHSGSSTRMAEDKAANVPTPSQVSYQSYETVTSESPSASSTSITAYDASLTPAQTPSTIAQPLETTSCAERDFHYRQRRQYTHARPPPEEEVAFLIFCCPDVSRIGCPRNPMSVSAGLDQ